MFATSCTFNGIVCNGLKEQIYETKRSQFDAKQVDPSTLQKKTFIKSFNSFLRKRTFGVNSYKNCDIQKLLKKENVSKVKVLQQFWNEHIKTKGSQSNSKPGVSVSIDQCNGLHTASTSANLKDRLPFEEFNKHKNADFVRRTKRKWSSFFNYR